MQKVRDINKVGLKQRRVNIKATIAQVIAKSSSSQESEDKRVRNEAILFCVEILVD